MVADTFELLDHAKEGFTFASAITQYFTIAFSWNSSNCDANCCTSARWSIVPRSDFES